LLGDLAENMSDEEVERLLIDSKRLVNLVFDLVEKNPDILTEKK
jgi:hypothetical protein